MKCLHQKRTDTTNQGSEVTVNRPRSIAGHEESTGFTVCDYLQPRWHAIGCTREQLAKFDREKLLKPVIFVIQLANRFFRGQSAFEQEVIDRIVDAVVRPTVGGVPLAPVGNQKAIGQYVVGK